MASLHSVEKMRKFYKFVLKYEKMPEAETT